MTTQYGFYLDSNSCTGCNACVMACKDKNNLPQGILWRRVYEMEGEGCENKNKVFSPDIHAFFTAMSCNHCQNPPCVISCPFGALIKREEDGLVIVDSGKCKGCRKCIPSCPYGSLQFNKDIRKIGKCDGCLDLLTRGEAPACIAACPMRAMEFGLLEELQARHPEAVPYNSIVPGDKKTLPSFLVKVR